MPTFTHMNTYTHRGGDGEREEKRETKRLLKFDARCTQNTYFKEIKIKKFLFK